MSQVKKGSRVSVFYTGRFNDGTVFETNIGQAPLVFSVGKGKVIKGFERAVIGMILGQTKTAVFKPSEAYGPKDPALVYTVQESEIPAGTDLQAGREISFTAKGGSLIQGVITGIDGDEITVDDNHPLAGRSLTFEIRLVDIK
ncbi:MAG: peptidylprolyl isomerase [Proteobacteria bacterium]|nr:peptidylprolyl isomerase [Pseudomonadota bacterium]MBU1708756.1 peptidylprolyl isomerase [Pseudomonadota bacterium]